jgi:DNA-binding FadR family transcriptional regulator
LKSTKTEDLATSRTAVRVASAIRRDIVTGRLRPGDMLKPERALCAEFGVSKPTLREAIRMLEAQSLLKTMRGQQGGPMVTPLDPGVAARQVGLTLQMEGATLEDVWRARAVLEPAAAAETARGGDRQAFIDLQENIDRAGRALDDPQAYAGISSEFSAILAAYCRNKTLRLLNRLLQDIVLSHDRRIAAGGYAAADVLHTLRLSIRARTHLRDLIVRGEAGEAEAFWRAHLTAMGANVLRAYRLKTTPVDMLPAPQDRSRPRGD